MVIMMISVASVQWQIMSETHITGAQEPHITEAIGRTLEPEETR